MKKFWYSIFVVGLVFGMASAGLAQPAVAPGGQGDALIGEVYEAKGSYATYFTVANDSSDYVTIHIRLRSARYSVEVWDKEFCLSPWDKTWFQLEEDMVTGGAYIFGEEIDSTPLRTNLLTELGFPDDPIETTAGYIEVFGVASNPLSAGRCYFPVEGAPIADVDNVLFGQVIMGDFNTGEYFGYNMTAIADLFWDPLWKYADVEHCNIPWLYPQGCANGIPVPADRYLDPDYATSFGPTWWHSDDAGIAINDALAKAYIKSDYYNGGFSGENFSMGVITFPHRYVLDSVYQGWYPGMVPADPRARRATIKVPSAVNFETSIWDFDERKWWVPPSPLCSIPPFKWDVNFVPVGDKSQEKLMGEFLVYLGDTVVDPADPCYRWPFNAPADLGWDKGWFKVGNFVPQKALDVEQLYPANNVVLNLEFAILPHGTAHQWQWQPAN